METNLIRGKHHNWDKPFRRVNSAEIHPPDRSRLPYAALPKTPDREKEACFCAFGRDTKNRQSGAIGLCVPGAGLQYG
jgi:hypothetical protein